MFLTAIAKLLLRFDFHMSPQLMTRQFGPKIQAIRQKLDILAMQSSASNSPALQRGKIHINEIDRLMSVGCKVSEYHSLLDIVGADINEAILEQLA